MGWKESDGWEWCLMLGSWGEESDIQKGGD